ncbi:MAG: hypothetical protein WD114_01030 [Phycisphaerales bacterium]
MHNSSQFMAGPIALAVAVILTIGISGGCTTADPREAGPAQAQERFWDALAMHCGQAFEGRVVEDSSPSPDFQGRMVMHVRECGPDRILVPFHIDDNRSRTWVFTREADGLRLKHDHRHEDGTEDDITQYGGDTLGPGTATRQEFHADVYTAGLIPAAAANVWTVEIVPGESFAYALRREGTDRRFRV